MSYQQECTKYAIHSYKSQKLQLFILPKTLDINECLEEGVCPVGGRCINTNGSYTCTMSCDSGYFLTTTINGGDACSGKKIVFDASCSCFTLPFLFQMQMSAPLEFTPVMIVCVLCVSTQTEAMSVFVDQATLEMESLASLLVLSQKELILQRDGKHIIQLQLGRSNLRLIYHLVYSSHSIIIILCQHSFISLINLRHCVTIIIL